MPGPDSRASSDQVRDKASALVAYADRNLLVTDGGVLSWDATTGTVTWTDTLRVWDLRSATPWTLAAGSTAGIAAASDGWRVVLDRDTPGAAVPSAVTTILDYRPPTDNSTSTGDGEILLGIRGSDGRLYLRDGTVIPDGGSTRLGARAVLTNVVELGADPTPIANYTDVLNGVSAADGEPDGSATKTDLGVEFVVGGGSLELYRGGARLHVDYAGGDFVSGDIATFPAFEADGARGDYHEVDAGLDAAGPATRLGTKVQFYENFEPRAGERLLAVVRY